MSFLKREFIPRGYIAHQPKKRLNSISNISIQPSKRRELVNPFKLRYEDPYLKIINEEEEAEAEEKQNSPSTMRKILKGLASAAQSTVNFLTLPARMVSPLDTQFNSAINNGETPTGKLIQSEEEQKSKLDDDDDNDVDDTSLRATQYLYQKASDAGATTLKSLKRLKGRWYGTAKRRERAQKQKDDEIVSAEDILRIEEEENERQQLQREQRAQELQAILRGEFVEKDYQQKMEQTKNLQALLRSHQQQNQFSSTQKATTATQEAIQASDEAQKLRKHFLQTRAATDDMIGLLRYRKFNKLQEEEKEIDRLVGEIEAITKSNEEDEKTHSSSLENVLKLMKEAMSSYFIFGNDNYNNWGNVLEEHLKKYPGDKKKIEDEKYKYFSQLARRGRR